jgi:hypothetical protein
VRKMMLVTALALIACGIAGALLGAANDPNASPDSGAPPYFP